ncbi:hypothetical protein QUB60_09655 [Microcoleus sp. A2-C5]|uniref:hypothetical protein n=1 Tax=unclassified Microcoleus TaxID=2642155 RepID=UPI002FD3C09B
MVVYIYTDSMSQQKALVGCLLGTKYIGRAFRLALLKNAFYQTEILSDSDASVKDLIHTKVA